MKAFFHFVPPTISKVGVVFATLSYYCELGGAVDIFPDSNLSLNCKYQQIDRSYQYYFTTYTHAPAENSFTGATGGRKIKSKCDPRYRILLNIYATFRY